MVLSEVCPIALPINAAELPKSSHPPTLPTWGGSEDREDIWRIILPVPICNVRNEWCYFHLQQWLPCFATLIMDISVLDVAVLQVSHVHGRHSASGEAEKEHVLHHLQIRLVSQIKTIQRRNRLFFYGLLSGHVNPSVHLVERISCRPSPCLTARL